MTSYSVWAGTLLLLPFAAGLGARVAAAPISSTLSVAYLGVGPAALAYVTWAMVLKRLPAGRAASLMYAVPVMAFLAGWVWLHEVPGATDILGGLLALSGVVVVNTLGRITTSRQTQVFGVREQVLVSATCQLAALPQTISQVGRSSRHC